MSIEVILQFLILTFCKKINLKIVDIKITDYHGKSIKIYFTKNSSQYKSTKNYQNFYYMKKI